MLPQRIRLKSGLDMPRLGQGTWRMGEDPSRRAAEVAALRLGIDLGMTLIDTAEMYAGAESVAGEAIRGRRDEVFLVTKVLPQSASFDGTIAACERSLDKLGTDVIDLYLLHWEGEHPLADTVAAFDRLAGEGRIRCWGVSNFDVGLLDDLVAVPAGHRVCCDQVLYNLTRRGPEAELWPYVQRHGIAVMAYSPLEQGRLRDERALHEVAERHGIAPDQVAIAWTLRHPFVATIPKALDPDHVRRNAAALDIDLDASDLAKLDAAYPRTGRALEFL